VNPVLTDTPPTAAEAVAEQQPAAPMPPPSADAYPGGGAAACMNCGRPMAPGQDWCLQCGAGAPGSVGAGGGWRPAAGVLAVTLALVLGAAAAGVAALGKKSRSAPVVTSTVAQAAPVATTPAAPVTPTTPPAATLPTQPPKIPLTAVTPKPAATTPVKSPGTSTPTTTGTPKATEKTSAKAKQEENAASKTGGAGSEPEAILLDTDAAQTYDPYNYPASGFGDPSLAIDGDPTTGWTAEVNPATAPKMAEGLLVDLKTPQKLSAVKLITSTPGIVVQVYGANGATVPDSITEKAWVPLSHQQTIKKRHAKIGLRNQKLAYRYVTLWISRAPESALGTAEAPGHVTVDELELFPAAAQ